MLLRLFISDKLQANGKYICFRPTKAAPASAAQIRALKYRFGEQYGMPLVSAAALALAVACILGFFCTGSLTAFPQPATYTYSSSLRDPLIPGAANTAPGQPAAPGQPPAIGSGAVPTAVPLGMGGSPLPVPDNLFPQVSNSGALPSTAMPPAKYNNTTGTNNAMLGPPVYMPPVGALDTTTINNMVVPRYWQPSPSTPGSPEPGVNGNNSGLIYAKQYTNSSNSPDIYPPASIGGVGPNGGIAGPAPPIVRWSAQSTHDYGLPRFAARGNVMSQTVDLGQKLAPALQATDPQALVMTNTTDGPRSTQYLNWTPADSGTQQTASGSPSYYPVGIVPRAANSYAPNANDTWNLFGHRQNFMYAGPGTNVPHSPNTNAQPIYSQETLSYF